MMAFGFGTSQEEAAKIVEEKEEKEEVEYNQYDDQEHVEEDNNNLDYFMQADSTQQ